MTAPTPYDRQTSFALFSAENPLVPHSGVSIDGEFNAVKVSLDETQQSLSLIQDDDGVLKRGSVGQAQFDSSVTIGFGAPSQWVSGKLYTANIDTVFNASKFYICSTTHTSGVSFDVTKWAVIADFTVAAVIADGSITSAKLAAAAVDATKIADGSISNSKIASGAVTTTKLADAAVTFAKLDSAMGPTLASLLIPAGLGPLPWSLPTLPVGWDWADGGVLLSSTPFPALRAAYIAASFPHGQDGSGNPYKPDMKGRVPIGWDTMGGAAANRMTTAGGGINGATFGSVGGSQTATLTLNQLPLGITSANSGTINLSVVSTPTNVLEGTLTNSQMQTGSTFFNMITSGTGSASQVTSTGTIAINGVPVTSNNTGGLAHSVTQPGLICGMIVKAH